MISTCSPGNLARRTFHRGRRWVHPLVDSFLPVTYTSEEYRRRIGQLDPNHARSNPNANPDTDRRIVNLATALGFDAESARLHLDEARQVKLVKVDSDGRPDLPSPMCCEDRYATYVVTRGIAPRRAVETGVAHGVSSAYILAAMEACGTGRLDSIDIDRDPRVGQCVPESLRRRWTMHAGGSLDRLPDLLHRAEPIDLFLHDSDHGCRHVWRELELVWPHVRPGGLVCAHDILHNNAFPRFIRRYRHEIAASCGNINFGVIRKAG